MIEMIPAAIPRVALVTGGARRLGRAIAVELARHGFDVAIHCNSSLDEALETDAQITALGRQTAVL
ncbi:MAG: hypothetical protein QOG73_106, partial [Acetobacteraceae bacterium]|nr:hypothetical protein [Acetobacteraceae bacterium]